MVGFHNLRHAHRLTRCSLLAHSSASILLKVGRRSYCTATVRSLLPLNSISAPLACFPRTSTHLLQYPFTQRHEQFCTTAGNEEKQKISVTFVDKDGEENHIKVPVGMSMLEAAHENDIELEGACEASLACSTCHVIVMDVEYYNKLEDPTDDENDMLDLAFGLTDTSRLGCQVIAKPELDGIRLALPVATRNFAVDGYKPKPH
ncbi:adrenodoxin-like protein 2, mitochondrial isoform X2 [Solanum dulcamara]|uniref:adrenodoxin-like protein 2, mitochondrial isoform X2 n=1 Tax=Solanum dulcamara TaxID=45834 RepID=UPI002484DC46|nr:adrenodoxin-like protein 2, mitochondrial isoform X2 [Solanum dulcamara]